GTQMAIIVMDVWNSHPDPEMASRGSALIPRMNEALAAARALGITVIFCPNEVAPPVGVNTAAFSGLPNQALRDNGFNPPLPSFTSSSSGDMVPVAYDAAYRPRFPTYTSQHPDLVIQPGDLASTSRQQIYNYCAAHGISYLLYMGVAANMCVCCTRETSMIPMKRFCGLEPILVRDLTDSMTLNGRRHTGVDDSAANVDLTMTPDRGHRLVVAQDESYVCSSIDARQLLQYWPPAAYSSVVTGNSNLLCFWQMNSRTDYQEIPDAMRTQSCWWNGADPRQTAGLSFSVAGAISNSPDDAVQFDGSTILISPLYRDDIPTNSPLFSLSSTNFSLETWVRPTVLNSNQWFYSHDDGTQGGVDVLLGLNSSNRFELAVGSDAGRGSFGDLLESDVAVTESDIASGHWFHIVGVHDRQNGTVSLYVDARLAAQSNEDCAPVGLSSAPHFGSRGVAALGSSRYLTRIGFEFYHGALDEFAIYSGTLDSNTILQHYQVGLGGEASPAMVSLQVGQGSGDLSWPAWPLGLRLQWSADLNDWQDCGLPVQEFGGTCHVSPPLTEPRQFFRLALP
ncbi:MAG TPA: LamG-like jellyroll fold domain-containing protein, partial [Verrucomicrobiae bacterium]|nr:LamG-like jellyroll fold domain-containing protein [Verrucomicrobiae bacterium]